MPPSDQPVSRLRPTHSHELTTLQKVGLVLGLSVAYVVGYLLLFPWMGFGTATLVLIPALTSARLFGARVGALSVAAFFVINTVLCNLTGTPGLLAVVHRGGGLGFVALFITAMLMGRLRDSREEVERARKAAQSSLLELKQAQEKLVRAEKLVAVTQLANALQHEINNPLAVAASNLTLFPATADQTARVFDATQALVEKARHSDDPELSQLANELAHLLEQEDVAELKDVLVTGTRDSLAAIERIRFMVANFAQLQDDSEKPSESVDLDAFLEEALLNLPPRVGLPGAVIQRMPATGTRVRIIPRDVRRAIANVLAYFARAQQNHGALRVELHQAEGQVRLSLCHPELALTARQRIELVEPKVRPDGAGRSMRMDLGLAVAFHLAARGGAELQVHHAERDPTTFSFVFQARSQGATSRAG